MDYNDKGFSIKSNFSTWETIRTHWKRNRIFFRSFFLEKSLPLRFIRHLEKLKGVDINLIFAWKELRYINLCSTSVLQMGIIKKKPISNCQRSLSSRKIHQVFLIEKSSGCICCANNTNNYGPIWWDEWKTVKKIFNFQKNNFFLFYLYINSVSNNLEVDCLKKTIVIRKLCKIFNTSFMHLSLLPISFKFAKQFVQFRWLKGWKFIY